MIYPPIIGQTFCDNYSGEIFDKLGGEGFGFTINFYSGFGIL